LLKIKNNTIKMLNEKKLTNAELNKREELIMKMKKNKRALVQKYGKDAEQVMYGRATNIAKKQAESMENDKLKEMVKTALQNPKAADLNKDGKLSDYEEKRGAAIEKNLDEIDINDPVLMKMRAAKMKAANAGDDGNDKFFAKNAARLGKLKALKDKRAQIMSDMEQEAELEGGPIADKYGDMLNKIDKAIAMLQGQGEWGPEKDVDITAQEIGKRAAMIGLEEGSSTEEKRIAMSAIKRLAKYRGVSTEEAKADLLRAVKELGDLKEEFDLDIDQEGGEQADTDKSQAGILDAEAGLGLEEDLDLGHQDNEPHMLKADLYRIGKYAMELYQMVDGFEGQGEVDFPHWWQSKIIKSKDMLVSAKHYLDFEVKEPQIDAMVDVAQDTEAIDENALGMTDSRLSSDQHRDLDYAVRGDSAYTFGNDPYADDQLRYKYAKKMGFLEEKKEIKEGTWAVGNAKDIQRILDTLVKLKDNAYNVVGDDDFFNGLDSAISRAEELMMNAPIQEEEAGEADMVASDIQKAMNKHKKDDAKIYQLQQARKAMNKGDLDKAKKIAARLAEKLKSN
jgi:hypothetical protein